ncbi:FAD-dependent oxidoreductase [Amphibiibacter pelophylacis]|uniref:FAD-dependent oxidoreductase n=1 Tax=Amphibiibacter pelophylacis TaxID=1799477 RepID=A0ACC6NZD7_9BURK
MPTLILAGAGHAHLALLQRLRRQTLPSGWRVVLVSPPEPLTYSGMLPGWLAGHYALDELQIPLQRLIADGPVELHPGLIVRLDAAQHQIHLASGEALGYDLLSLDVGGVLADFSSAKPGPHGAKPGPVGAMQILPVRPLDTFIAGWQAFVDGREAQAGAQSSPAFARIAVAGGGAGAIELALAAAHTLRRWPKIEVHLIAPQSSLLAGHAPGVRRAAIQELGRAGIARVDARLVRGASGPALSTGQALEADLLIVATGAQAQPWLADSGLAVDSGGFVQVDATQRSSSHADVYAAGDVCARVDGPFARSGVHAVKAGPALTDNLLARMAGRPATALYRPRRSTLYLLACGPRRAVLSWGKWHSAGALEWQLKRWIDTRFMTRQRCGL